MSAEDIELAADWEGDEGSFVAALVAVRFIDGEDGAYMLHDWEEHNPWAAGSNRRREVAKANAAKKWGGPAALEGETNAQKRSARLAEARKKGTHTAEEWEVMKDVCGRACVECGCTDKELTKDHIVAICKGGSDAIANIQPLCSRCNASKGANGSDRRPANWFEMLSKRLPNACQTFEGENGTSAPSPSPSPSPSPNSVPIGTGGDAASKKPRTAAEQRKSDLWRSIKALLVESGESKDLKAAGAIVTQAINRYDEAIALSAIEATLHARPAGAIAFLEAACQQASGQRLNKQEALEAANLAAAKRFAEME